MAGYPLFAKHHVFHKITYTPAYLYEFAPKLECCIYKMQGVENRAPMNKT